MDVDELTRQAAEELMRDAKKFMQQRESQFKATQLKQPMKTNKRFLGNTLRDVMAYNKNQDKQKKNEGEGTSNEKSKSEKKSSTVKQKTIKKTIKKRGDKR